MTSVAARVLLVLPTASYRAAAFLDAARALGLEVVVAAEHASSLGSRVEGRELVVDLGSPAGAGPGAARLHALAPFAGVVGVDESAVMTAAAIAAALGLRHHPSAAVAATRDKRLLRRALAAAGVRQPQFTETTTAQAAADPDTATAAAGGYPVVAKPVGLAASQGVLRADDGAQLAAAAARIGDLLDSLGCERPGEPHPLLVEHFVPGVEVAVEGIVRDGRVEVLAIFDKPDPLDGPTFAETLYVTPSRRPQATQAAIMALTVSAARALGLSDGPLHAEVRVDPMTGPVLIEVAARSIGGLCSRAIHVSGIDPRTLRPEGRPMSLEEVILRHACGLPLPERCGPAPGASGVLMLPVARSGVVRRVEGVAAARRIEGVISVDVGVPVGAAVQALPEGSRYLGFVVAAGDHPLRVERALRRAWTELSVEIA